MNPFRATVVFLAGLLLVVASVGWVTVSLSKNREVEQEAPRATEKATTTPIAITPSATVSTPQKPYLLGEKIDLASEKPLLVTIMLDDGAVSSNWAVAKAYQDGDDARVFEPWNGVIYSYEDDSGLTVTYAHSGFLKDGRRLFASDFDLYIRKMGKAKVAEALERADSLEGKIVRVCQDETGLYKPFEPYDPEGECSNETRFRIVKAMLVLRDEVADYDQITVGIGEYVEQKYLLEVKGKSKLWLIRFCVGQMIDQPSADVMSYLYNRGMILLELVE